MDSEGFPYFDFAVMQSGGDMGVGVSSVFFEDKEFSALSF